MHALVSLQYFVLRDFKVHVVVQRREKSTSLPSRSICSISSSPVADPFSGTGILPGSDHTTLKNNTKESNTPNSNASARNGTCCHRSCRASAKYWKVAKDTDINQHTICKLLRTKSRVDSAIATFRKLSFFLVVVMGASRSQAALSSEHEDKQCLTSYPFRLKNDSSSFAAARSPSAQRARSRAVAPSAFLSIGATPFSNRHSKTEAWAPRAASCSAVFPDSSTCRKFAPN
mmetsp:Transcript_22863/g.63909  ORF Transcript_22863/g.63909 Transcript_22863/m.63909 type:complete len:231 (+) Transcript_22863:593-1285(+)